MTFGKILHPALDVVLHKALSSLSDDPLFSLNSFSSAFGDDFDRTIFGQQFSSAFSNDFANTNVSKSFSSAFSNDFSNAQVDNQFDLAFSSEFARLGR